MLRRLWNAFIAWDKRYEDRCDRTASIDKDIEAHWA